MSDSKTALILAEIARAGSTRATIAAAYRDARVLPREYVDADFVDWPTVNAAVLRRYKLSGLRFIKALAWKA